MQKQKNYYSKKFFILSIKSKSQHDYKCWAIEVHFKKKNHQTTNSMFNINFVSVLMSDYKEKKQWDLRTSFVRIIDVFDLLVGAATQDLYHGVLICT